MAINSWLKIITNFEYSKRWNELLKLLYRMTTESELARQVRLSDLNHLKRYFGNEPFLPPARFTCIRRDSHRNKGHSLFWRPRTGPSLPFARPSFYLVLRSSFDRSFHSVSPNGRFRPPALNQAWTENYKKQWKEVRIGPV